MRTFKISAVVDAIFSEPIMIDAEDREVAIVKFLDTTLCLNLAMHQFENAVRMLRNDGNAFANLIQCDEVLK